VHSQTLGEGADGRSDLTPGIGFETSVLCYFGSLAHNIREIVSGDAKPQGPVVYVLAGVSLFSAVLAATLATISVKYVDMNQC